MKSVNCSLFWRYGNHPKKYRYHGVIFRHREMHRIFEKGSL